MSQFEEDRLNEEDYLVVVAYVVKARSRQQAVLKKVTPGTAEAVIYGTRAFEMSEMIHNQVRTLGITRDSEPPTLKETVLELHPPVKQ